ncbi:MAG: hypothetical protein RI900_963 [Actinomycetota bacterium]|jgi:hypothetical protein
MSQVPAGWFPDPYGRYEQRWWSGVDWTANVATGGAQAIDPMGNSPVVPFAMPVTATSADAAAASTAGIRFLDRMGRPALERTPPSLRASIAGVGGAVTSLGLLAAAAGDAPNRTAMCVVAMALVALGWLLRRTVTVVEVGAAAVGVAAVGVVAFAAFASVRDGSSGSLTALIAAAMFLGLWFAPGFRGHNLMLGAGLLSVVGAIGALTATSSTDLFDEGGGLLPTEVTDNLGNQGALYLAAAAGLLGLTWVLDRRSYRGTATAACAAGLISALVGVVLLADRFGETSGPVFVCIVGFLVCVVGSHGGRRATTWIGAALASAGLVAFVAVQVQPESTSAVGVTGIVAGVVLVLLPWLSTWLRRRSAAASDGSGALP